MHSLDPDYLDRLRFDATQLATLRAIGECRGKQTLYTRQVPELLKALRQTASIESAESSNRLEGITVSAARLKPLVLKNQAPRDRSEQELAGYRDALALIHESGPAMPFSAKVILQIHALMYRYMPNPGGRWKQTENTIVERHPDGSSRVRFRPTPAHLAPIQMEALVQRYREAADRGGHDPLVLVPLAILDFLCIHPFHDGNGRSGRLLTLMLLYHYGYEVGRYISLERVIEESKESYYAALEKSSARWHQGKHDINPWLNYFWGALLAAYREFEQRVAEAPKGLGSKTGRVRAAVKAQAQPFSISEIEAACPGVSRDMVRVVLRQMKEEELIVSTGKGRGAKWMPLSPISRPKRVKS
jgi:Fic family protein